MSGPLFYHRVLEALLEAEATFVLIGGVALNLRGVPRFTSDLDLAVPLEHENLRRIGVALTGLGLAPRLPVPVTDLADPARVREWVEDRNLMAFTFQNPQNPIEQVDLVLHTPVPFDEIDASATIIRVAGSPLRVASSRTLIRMKTGTGRAQDASDIEALTRLLELGGD